MSKKALWSLLILVTLICSSAGGQVGSQLLCREAPWGPALPPAKNSAFRCITLCALCGTWAVPDLSPDMPFGCTPVSRSGSGPQRLLLNSLHILYPLLCRLLRRMGPLHWALLLWLRLQMACNLWMRYRGSAASCIMLGFFPMCGFWGNSCFQALQLCRGT